MDITIRILFIGNSYTFYHDMPQAIFRTLADAAGLETEVTSVTKGGVRLIGYTTEGTEQYELLENAIAGKRFDVVVLQEQSHTPITAEDVFLDGVQALKHRLSGCADSFVLYATWGRKEGCELLGELGMTAEEMNERLASAYDRAAARFGMKVAHVGKAFADFRIKYPDLELYDPDRSHPSAAGSLLAACTLLETVRSL